MNLSDIKKPRGATHRRRIVGRGVGSGMDKTAGRGHKGGFARTGRKHKRGFEGGQMPLYKRMPKRGFTNIFKKQYLCVNTDLLEKHFNDGDKVTLQILKEKHLVKGDKKIDGLKILGNGAIKKKLILTVQKISESAKSKILDAGGSVEIV